MCLQKLDRPVRGGLSVGRIFEVEALAGIEYLWCGQRCMTSAHHRPPVFPLAGVGVVTFVYCSFQLYQRLLQLGDVKLVIRDHSVKPCLTVEL